MNPETREFARYQRNHCLTLLTHSAYPRVTGNSSQNNIMGLNSYQALLHLMQGASASVGVELVEIHNDEDSVYSSALDQVRSFEHRVT